MRALIDTHVLLWWATGSARLSAPAQDLIKDGRNEVLWSVASTWELSIKESLGRIRIAGGVRKFLKEVLRDQAIRILPIRQAHALAVGELPRIHRDPFDRMLVAQARTERLPLISGDAFLTKYDVELIW